MTSTPIRITDSRLLREDEDLMARVDALAKKTRRTRSAMLAVLVEKGLEAEEEKG